MSSRPAQSSPPSIATLALWPGAGMRRSAPFLAHTCARSGWVSASDSSPNRSTISPASAWALSRCYGAGPPGPPRPRPGAPSGCGAHAANGNPLLTQHNRQPRVGDAHARARLDLVRQTGQRPVRAIRHRPRQNLLGHGQRPLGFARSWPRRDRFLQRLDPTPHEGAAPEPNRILADPKSLGDLAAGPARKGEHDRTRPVRLAAIPRVAQSNQLPPLFFVRRNRGFARHSPNLKSAIRRRDHALHPWASFSNPA